MEQILDPHFYAAQWEAARGWLAANAVLLSVSTIGQIVVIVAAFAAARLIGPRLQTVAQHVAERRRFESQLRRVAAAVAPLTLPIVWLVLLWAVAQIASQAELPRPII